MATNYPGGLDNLTNPDGTGTLATSSTGDSHSTLHADERDAIDAIQAELGLDPAGSYDTVVLRLADLVAKTIADAKGDLIVATAADTLARIAVGADDTVLTADSGEASGVKWAAAAGGGVDVAPFAGNVHYGFPGVMVTATAGGAVIAANTTYYLPIEVKAGITLTEMHVDVTSAGGNLIIGVYAATSAMQPTGAAVASSGVIDVSGTGRKDVTGLSDQLTAGLYLVSLNADSAVTLDSVRGCVPGCGGMRNNFSQIPNTFIVSRTYDGTNPASPPAWSNNNMSTLPPAYPFGLVWTVD